MRGTIFFTPNASNKAGMAIPPTEFTQSTATEKPAFLMASTSTNFNDNTLSICLVIDVLSFFTCPKFSISTNSKSPVSAIRNTSLPSSAFRNSPFSFNSFNAFHCLGLWLAVRIIPPQAASHTTASSVVGVVARPKSTTSNPIPTRVPITQ